MKLEFILTKEDGQQRRKTRPEDVVLDDVNTVSSGFCCIGVLAASDAILDQEAALAVRLPVPFGQGIVKYSLRGNGKQLCTARRG